MKIPLDTAKKMTTPHFVTGGKVVEIVKDEKKPGVQVAKSDLVDIPVTGIDSFKSHKRTSLIVSPLMSEDLTKALHMSRYANMCVKNSLLMGEAPISFHSFYYSFLSVGNTYEKDLSLYSALSWVKHCDLVCVYTDYGNTEAMQVIENYAKHKQRRIEYRSIGMLS